MVNAAVKLYTLWRLPQQRWVNRGNQSANSALPDARFDVRRGAAAYLTTLSVAALILVAVTWTGLVHAPRWGVVFMLEGWLG